MIRKEVRVVCEKLTEEQIQEYTYNQLHLSLQNKNSLQDDSDSPGRDPIGKKPLKCTVATCNNKRIFSYVAKLKNHIKSHQLNPFQCSTCFRCFKTERSLELHQLKKHLKHERPYRYTSCDKCYAGRNGLMAHQETHTKSREELRQLPCTLCRKRFKNSNTPQYHIIAAHTGEKIHNCQLCQKEFIRRSQVEIHQRRVHLKERIFLCKVIECGRRFFSEHELNVHSIRKHCNGTGQPIRKPFKCPLCKRLYLSKQEVTVHLSTHTGEKPFSCSFCAYTTNYKHNLKTHVIGIHERSEKNRVHSCTICNKTFLATQALRLHYRVHTKEKPHKCLYCGKSFSAQRTLKTHMLLHTGEKPYPCKFCDKEFGQLAHLKRHLRGHTGEIIFKCAQCEKTFNEKGYLKEHELSHTGEKPLSCKVCGKAYRTLRGLRYHEVTHGEKKFGCNECDRKYFHRRELVYHKRRTHDSIERRRASEF